MAKSKSNPTMKRKAANESKSTDNKVSKQSRPRFILAPCAGGHSPKDVVDALETLGSVHTIEGRWANLKFDSKKNVDKVLDVIKEAYHEDEDSLIWLCGTSFGCRVLTEIINNHQSELSTNWNQALLFIGYPFFGPKETSDRVSCLEDIASDVHITFISGEKDDFLSRLYLKTKGEEALLEIANKLQASTTVNIISRGKHNPLSVSKALLESAREEFEGYINTHMKSLT